MLGLNGRHWEFELYPVEVLEVTLEIASRKGRFIFSIKNLSDNIIVLIAASKKKNHLDRIFSWLIF